MSKKKKHKPIKVPKPKPRNPIAESGHARKSGAMHDKRQGKRALQKELQDRINELLNVFADLDEIKGKASKEFFEKAIKEYEENGALLKSDLEK